MEEVPEFDPKAWLATGKKYNLNTLPQSVVLAKAERLAIPNTIAARAFPRDDIPVSSFLRLSLPTHSSEEIAIDVEDLFSFDSPTASYRDLMSQHIPPRKIIRLFQNAAGQAWLDGKTSIRDWQYADPVYFDLWIISFWHKMGDIVALQQTWQKAQEKLDALTPKSVLHIEAQMLLSQLGWNAPLPWMNKAIRASSLAVLLLSDEPGWLDDNHLDTMVEIFNHCMESGYHPFRPIIAAPTTFTQDIEAFAKSPTRAPMQSAAKYLKLLQDGTFKRLLCPVLVTNHWVVAQIDTELRRIDWGDSKSIPPTRFAKAFVTWGDRHLDGPFQIGGNTLEHGLQPDVYNCGLYAANTIAHAMFDEPVFESTDQANNQRLNWFRYLAKCTVESQISDYENPCGHRCPITLPITHTSDHASGSLVTTVATNSPIVNDEFTLDQHVPISRFTGSVKGRPGDSERKVKTRQNAEPASDTGDVEIISSSTFHSSRKRPLSSPGNPLVETKKAKLTQPVSRRSDSELDKLKCIPSTPVPADRHTELAPTPQCPGVVTDHGPAQAEAMEGGADITGSDSKAVLHSIQRYQKEAKTTRADAAATRIETQKCRGELEAYRRDLQMDGSRGTIGSLDPFLEVLMDLQARCSKLEAWKLQQMVDLSRGTRALYAGISPARRLYDAASRVATLLTHFDPNVRSLEDEEITVETLFKTLEGALGSFGSHA